MSAQIIDGKKTAELVRAEWKLRADKLIQSGIKPGLAVIIVGDDPASAIYVKNKVKACSDVGIYSEVHGFGKDAKQYSLGRPVFLRNRGRDQRNSNAGLYLRWKLRDCRDSMESEFRSHP